MYAVSEEFSKQIKANNREFSVALTFNSTTELTGTTVQKIAVDEIVNSTDVLNIGCACSHKATINLIDAPRDIDYKNSSFTARMGLKLGEMPTRYEEVPLGKFYVTDVQTTNDYKNVTITAFDGFCKMTGTYLSAITGKTTLQAVYDDLKDKLYSEYGIVLKTAILPEYELEFTNIENLTYQQAIGYIAGCLGGFARFDRYGELEISAYTDTNIVVSREEQYMNGFKKLTDTPLTVTSVSTGTKDNIIVRGDGSSGIAINFENPYITEDMADDVYAEFKDFTYTPCQLKWRGNPAIQAGDVVYALDSTGNSHKVLVMSQSIKIGGGLHQVIDSKGKSEATSKFSNNFEPASQKIDRVYNTLAQAIINATKAITGNSGGYVVLNDTPDEAGNKDGFPDEILVMDSPSIEAARNVWRWNKAGLGHSSEGYNGPYTLAILADGSINADCITTGTLSSNRIRIGEANFAEYINVENGVMTFGDENEFTLKLGYIDNKHQVSFFYKGSRKAIFTDNGIEFENLTDGKIRFQDFGYIPRSSGNLTFTKLK